MRWQTRKLVLPLLPKTTIGQLFPDIPGEDYYIVVANGMTLRRYLIRVLLCSCC